MKIFTSESFCSDSHSWGFEKGMAYSKWDNELTKQIVGPNPNSSSLNTWQYRPDRSLVDYKFYEFGKLPNTENEFAPLRLEPSANADLGKIEQCPSIVNDPFVNNTTRIPDSYSTKEYYGIPQSTLI